MGIIKFQYRQINGEYMKQHLFYILLFILVSSHTHQPSVLMADSSNKDNRIIVGIDEWPPYHSEHLNHFGFGTHIIVEAFKAVGVETQIKFMPWKRALGESHDGIILDATIWGGYTDWIDTHYGSDPVIKGEYVLFIRKGLTLDFQNPGSFKGLRFGNLVGEGIPDQLQEIVAKKGLLEIQSTVTVKALFQMLVYDRIDMIAINRAAGLSAMKEYLSEADRTQVAIHPDRFRLSLYRLVLSNKFKEKKLSCWKNLTQGWIFYTQKDESKK